MRSSKLLRCVAYLLLIAGTFACGSHRASRSALSPPPGGVLSKLENATALCAGGFEIFALDDSLRDNPLALRFISTSAAADSLQITSLPGAPSSLYLYVKLPQGFAASDVTFNASSETLAVAVPGRLPGVVPIGIAAIKGASGLSFSMCLRIETQASAVLSQPCAFKGAQRLDIPKSVDKPFGNVDNQVHDLQVTANGTFADLQWTEVNTGDYNNSGDVGVSDVTPLAMHYNELADTPERELIDGNRDGVLNVQDVTQIAMNFASEITGYEVTAVEIPSIGYEPTVDEFFAAVPFADPDTPGEPHPSVKRTKFYVDGDPPKAHILYNFGWNMNSGSYAVAVRAYSVAGDDYAPVLFSNFAKAEFTTGGNSAPHWTGQQGLQAAVAGNQKVTLSFGDAADPDGDQLHFIVYWEQNTTVYPPVAQSMRFDRSTLGSPPFSVDITGLTNGLVYTFLVWVYDEHDLRENPPNMAALSATPYLYVPNAYPWPYLHKDEKRSGTLGAPLIEPLVEIWNKPYKVNGTYNESSPVLDNNNVYIGSVDGRVYAFHQSDGSLVYSQLVDSGTISSSTAALWENRLVIGGSGKYWMRDLSNGDAMGSFQLSSGNPVRSSPLIVNGVAYVGSEEGIVYAFDILTSSEKWHSDLNSGPISGGLSSDGTFVYAASQNGYVHKLDILDGTEVLKSVDLGTITFATPVLYPADAPIVIIIGTDTSAGNSKYYALAASNLQVATQYPTDYGVQGAPVVVNDGTRNLVIAGQGDLLTSQGYVSAHDLITGEQVWRTNNVGRIFGSPAASANRIFAGSVNGHFYVLDFLGNIKQDINLGAPIYASPALSGGRVFIPTSDMKLYCLEAQPDTQAPIWQGTEGARTVSTGFGEATLSWDYATDDFYSPVYYNVYASENKAQVWDGQPVASMKGNGTVPHNCTVTGLQDGVRYYFGVRASDRPLWDNPNIEANDTCIGATPPWNLRAQLSLQDSLPAPPDSVITYFDTAPSLADGDLRIAYAVEGSNAELRYATYNGAVVTPDSAVAPITGVVRCMEMGEDPSGTPIISLADDTQFTLALRQMSGTWDTESINTFIIPSQPAFSTSLGVTSRLQSFFDLVTGIPEEEVSLNSRKGDLVLWDVPEHPDALDPSPLEKGIHLKTALVDFGDGNGEIPLIFYEKATEYYTGSTLPSKGSLMLARYDSTGLEWNILPLDTGASIDGNTGRNLQLLVDTSAATPIIHLAYYDLHASDVSDIAYLRHATYDGASFIAEDVTPVSVPDFLAPASAYYHDPALAMVDGQVALATYSRVIDPVSGSDPLNYDDVIYCRYETAGSAWIPEKVIESTPLFLHFRAPLGLEVCPAVSDYPLLVFPVDPGGPLDGATAIQIWQRGPL
jgi:eukaryotic-like serine/threonine-protein kinase